MKQKHPRPPLNICVTKDLGDYIERLEDTKDVLEEENKKLRAILSDIRDTQDNQMSLEEFIESFGY